MPRARYLGAADAPAAYQRSSGGRWRLAAPYSLPLTGCTVTISRAGHVVRHLSCRKAAARQGLADVRWDGTDDNGHTVAAGDYVWRLLGRSAAGAARKENGANGPVTGTLTIS